MEENVALDSSKQKKFVKSIRGIKKLIKKNEKASGKPDEKTKSVKPEPVKPFSMRLKDGKIKKKKRKERGLVYIAHIPHGFYEHQMTEYFKQFGVVTNARVIRSKRTGNSKGFAFVEFKETSVAQIVAETMNNYLMGKRLLKASYIPPEKQRRKAFRKNWNSQHNPTSIKRLKLKKAFNAVKDESEELKKAKKLLYKLNKTKEKLKALGIDYDFFTPVDVPEQLLGIVKKEEEEDTVKEENDTKVKDKNINKNNKVDKQPNNKKQQEQKKEIKSKDNKKENIKSSNVNGKDQKEKEKKLKDAGVKSVEEFISLEGDEDSDDSGGFDSDEFEKMLASDDDDLSSGESGDETDDESGSEEASDDEDSGDENDESMASIEDSVPKGKKGNNLPKAVQITKQPQNKKPQQPQNKKPQQPQNKKSQQPQNKKPQHQQGKQQPKRTNQEKSPVAAKKTKFEKQDKKTLNKQFKKK